ncbi:hypothetical protein BBJ28_00000313 [Nothophytophthora sp. Chile5]|nr:hypothetical protein BBJ28_00000313 [Nothophytophthora sp. Chile5]
MAKLARAMALVRAARLSGLHARPLVGVGQWRAYSDDVKTPAVNPFEIQLNLPDQKGDGALPSLSLDDAKRAAAAQKAEAEREISLLHSGAYMSVGTECSAGGDSERRV